MVGWRQSPGTEEGGKRNGIVGKGADGERKAAGPGKE